MIAGNFIGTDVNGTAGLGNGTFGTVQSTPVSMTTADLLLHDLNADGVLDSVWMIVSAGDAEGGEDAPHAQEVDHGGGERDGAGGIFRHEQRRFGE